MDAMNLIMGLVRDVPVVIFSKSCCGMSCTVKSLISSYGARVTVYELDEIPNGKDIEKALAKIYGREENVPSVFIGQQLVGGTSEIMALQVRGKLGTLLRQAKAIWV